MQKGSFSLTTSDWRLFVFCFLYFSLVAGTQAECPVQLSQKSVVVEYGGSVAVNCTASVPHDGMGWEASEGGVDKTRASVITWRVSDLTEWEIQPFCFINYNKSHDKPCEEELPVTVYKTPDSVSISTVFHSRPMMEGEQYELRCDVQDVAPVQNLTVKWYKEQTLVDQITFTDTIKTPVNKTATLLIRPDRADDGAQYRCEAELDLGAEGPQPLPNKTSETLSITVHFKPIINETKLPSIVTVFRGYSVVLVCEAEGNPKPNISWSLGGVETVDNETLIVSESTPQNVFCNASNSVGWTTRQVKVSIQDISISFVNHEGPVIAGKVYELQCLIKNGAPSKIVSVRWYQQNQIISTIKTPVSNIPKLQIQINRADDGALYRCEADLEAEEPQRYQTMSSEHLNITVHFKPIINESKLPSTVPVFRGYPEVLSCEAEGNPKPIISWSLGANDIEYGEKLNISELTPENVYCNASNSVGSTTRQIKVVLKEDYLPLIAGLIAITVAFISVIFVFIYSIYYKTAKMGRYSLKDAKPSAPNENIAQNGKHNPIPMKKLSQSNILA